MSISLFHFSYSHELSNLHDREICNILYSIYPKYSNTSSYVLKFEQIQFTTWCCVQKFLDEWQTKPWWDAPFWVIWVFNVGSRLSVRIHAVNTLYSWIARNQGPVVQTVVSLTSSLRVISLTVLADSIYNILIFFAEKTWVAFALQKLLTFFQRKISAYLHITQCKF